MKSFTNYHYNHHNHHNHHNANGHHNNHNHHHNNNHNTKSYYSSTSISNGNFDNNNFLSTNNNYNGNGEYHKNDAAYQNGKMHLSKVPSIVVSDTDRNTHSDHSSGSQMIAKRQANDEKREQYRAYVEEMFKLYPTVKWPLYNTWSFWFSTNDRTKKDWKDNLIRFADVSYIEDFWSVFNYLVSPSNLETFTDLGLFKKGIMPMWEDQENKHGGRWLLSLNIQQRKLLDEIWLNSVLALIGDCFCGSSDHDSDHVCDNLTGICVQNRPKTDKIALWTKDYKNERVTRIIGRKWKENIEIFNQTISFEPHDSQFAKGSSSKFIYEE